MVCQEEANMSYKIEIKGINELQSAIKRNPQVVKQHTQIYFTRALAKYKSTIINNPWRIGMSGGGAPVKTGNLRDTHITQTRTWEALIKPTASYAEVVHKKRPWLEYAVDINQKEVESLEKDLLDSVISDLSN